MKISHYHHASLLIKDLDRAADFYENTLGLTRITRPNLGFAGLWYAVGDLQLHLLQCPSSAYQQNLPEHVGKDRHLAFVIDSLTDLKMRLDAKNIPYTLSRSGRKALFCRDPDLNGLEFMVI